LLRYPEKSDLLFKPGTKFSYSNFGYNILAYIVRQISGKSFGNDLKEKIFDPSGMIYSCQYENETVTPGLARGYEYKLLHGYKNADYVDASLTTGSGGLIATSYDLYLFDRAMYSEKLLKNELKNYIFRSYSAGGYGYGWFIDKRALKGSDDSITIADHSGSIDGFGSYMARILSDSSLVIILKNQRADTYIDPAYAPEIGKQIISIIYDGEEIPYRESIAHYIAPLIGKYGIDSAVSEYHKIVKINSNNYNMSEPELNRLGIELFFRFGMAGEALKIFELNMIHFPRSYNTYDSYAYLLRQQGDYVNSIKFYKKGLNILKKYPEENDSQSVRDDATVALKYIEDMEMKIKSVSK